MFKKSYESELQQKLQLEMNLFKSIFLFSFLSFFCISFSSCQSPRIESIDNISIQEMSENGILAKVDVNIFNPKQASFQCKNLKVKLYYKEVELANGNSDEKIVLKAKKSTTVPFDIVFSMEVLEKFGDELLMQDSILISGKFEGDFTLLDIHQKEDIEYWLKTKDIMDKIYDKFLGEDGLAISKKVKSINLTTVIIDLKMNIINTLSIPIEVNELNVKIFKDRNFNNSIGVCSKVSEIELNPDSSETIQAELKLSTIGTLTSVTTFFHYYLKGYIAVLIKGRKLKVPIIQHIKVNPLSGDVDIIKD